MENKQKNPKENAKVAPDVANDQLGENATMEFAHEYDNKNKPSQSETKTKK